MARFPSALFSFFNLLFSCGVLMSCANADDFYGGRSFFQSIEIGNNGHQSVSQVSLLYGSQQLILGPARAQYPAGNIGHSRYAQGLDSPIPKETQIRWTTDDGIPHEASVKTLSLIRDTEVFYGFRFYFVDARIDVYLIEKIPNPAMTLDLKYTKVYSSP